MSAIYGYWLKDSAWKRKCYLGLSYWNKPYGKKEIRSTTQNLTMAVNLEHFSEKVKEQTEVLQEGSLTAVIDAVLFNREELAKLYGLPEDISDEEMLFRILVSQGTEHLQGVNGDFAGALYDEARGELTLFRDHLGIRPIYYYTGEEGFVFSTDIRGILAFDQVDFTVDEKRIYAEIMGALFNQEENTEYRQIQYLRSASCAVFDLSADRPMLKNKMIYWHPRKNKIRLKDDEAYKKELRRLTEDAIRIRMDACDGPIGAELSGGLDSTVISCMIQRLGHEGRYYSWSLDPAIVPIQSERDERLLIQEVCDRDKITCKFRGDANPEANLNFHDLANRCDPSFINCPAIREAAYWFGGQGVHMVMTGHGGDEGVSRRLKPYELWYHREYIPYLRSIFEVSKGKKLRLLRAVKRFYVQTFKESPRKLRAEQEWDHIEAYAREDFMNRIKGQVESPEFTFFYDPARYIEMGIIRHRMNNTTFQTPGFGVRYMYPYLDYRLLDFALSIPRNLFYREGRNRWLYWETFQDLLPQSIRKLYSKRTLSKEGKKFELSDQAREAAQDARKDAVSMLDREYWAPYLDLDKLEQEELPRDCREEDYDLYVLHTSRLLFFILSRNAILKAPEPIKKLMEEDRS